MKAIGDLPRLRRALTRGLRIEASAVAADHLHFRMLLEPVGRGRRRTIPQQVHYLTALQVHDDRAVVGALPPRPIINASHMNRAVIGPSSGMLLQAAQDRRVADRHAEPFHQPLRGPPASAMGKQPNDTRQASGLARKRRRKTRKALGKDAPTTSLVSTPPARQACFNDDWCSLSGQIPKRSRVSAVTRCGLRTASRTGSRLPVVHRYRPSLFSQLDADDV